jgi:PAS domain S-box-containing protein
MTNVSTPGSAIGDAVIATDNQARVTFVNPVAEALTGWPLADAVGRPLAEVFRTVNEQTRQPVEDPAAKVLRLGTVVGLANHTALLARDGRETPIDDCGAPIIDDPGAIAGVVLVFRDVTQRRGAEEAEGFRRANQRMELALRGSNVGVWDHETPDADYRRRRRHYVNVWEQLGYAGPPAGGETTLDAIHPDDRVRVEEAVRRYLAGESTEYETEARFRHKDGSYRTLLARGVAVRDAAGKPIRFVGVTVDVTQLKLAEEALRQANARLDLAMRGSNLAIWECDMPDGRIENSHPTLINVWELLGYDAPTSPTDFPSAFALLFHPEDQERVRRELQELFASDGQEYESEYRVRSRDGSTRWHLARGTVLRDPKGKPVRFIGASADITDLKRLAEELRQAKEAAEAASRAKDEFLANVSHEIRTPMNAILGMTELVLDTPLDEDQRQGLKTVKSAADSLLGIINDLLDFSKMEAGKLGLAPADFSLRAAVGDTLRALALRAHKKGLELIYQVQPDVPDALIGDAGRLRQVLLNLAGNAVKFTDAGEVVVRVEVQGDGLPPSPGAGEVGLRFTVRDTGIGIPPDQQERIFRAFEQEDTSTTRKYGGTGLGLTIAARLVALMGGTITVDSAPGRGSTFAFTARFGRQPHPPEPVPAQPPVSLHNLPVLVVDDSATNRHILAEWLLGWQMNPTTVGDGMAAMDALWHRAANGRPYALVLLDARMPDADGLTVAAMIRERAELAATRILLLTSGERPGDPTRFRDLRIDAQLLKPVQQDELLETIYRVMSRSQGNAPPLARPTPTQQAPSAPVPTMTPLHILVAEDTELSAQVLEQSLVRQGHRVRLASNGREALALAEQGGFDLLLLDVHMPELDGFQVVQAVRERELTAGGRLPIIALTARSRKEDRERCLAAGMDDFLTKPIRRADLLAAIDRVLRTHSSRQSRRRDLLDAPVLSAACGGEPTLLRKMCQTLTARVPEHLAVLREALRDQDAPRLREAAHKCCGLLSEFSAAAGDLAGSPEELAAGTQLDKAAPILEQLETMAHELVKQVDGITVEALRRQAEGMDEHHGTAGP